jgi:hypothetical protein
MPHIDCQKPGRAGMASVCGPNCTDEPAIGLGDIVSLGWSDSGYDTATVSQVYEDGTVDLFRPYTHTADFSYTGGVICYVGIENISRAKPNRLKLIRKGQPLK